MAFKVGVQFAMPNVRLMNQARWIKHGKCQLQERICLLAEECPVPDIVHVIISFCATRADEMNYWNKP